MSEHDARREKLALARTLSRKEDEKHDNEETVERNISIFVLLLAEPKTMWYITDVDSLHLGKNLFGFKDN